MDSWNALLKSRADKELEWLCQKDKSPNKAGDVLYHLPRVKKQIALSTEIFVKAGSIK